MEQNVIPMKKFEEIKLQPQHYSFLKTRGISESTADAMKLFPAEKYFQRLNRKTDAIGFPYFKNGKFISAKYRSIESKDFTQDMGGSQDFFGIDKIDPSKPVIIVEGEIDALTLME
jgi:twinkle protein